MGLVVSIRREKKKDEKKHTILASAEALVRAQGHTEFSMAELSRSAGLSTATIYNLLQSKASVLYALLNSSLDKVIAATPAQGNDPVENAIRASEIAANTFTSDTALFKPLYRYLLGVSDPVHRPAFMGRALAFWMEHLAGLRDAGMLPPGVGLEELARDHQIYFLGTLDLWVQGELSDEGFRAQIIYSSILRLYAVPGEAERGRLAPLAESLGKVVRAEAGF
ncbi:TetR/AcrR family transcriptional regulator [Novosphingobium sp. 9U]|uniref:TetR/AcrR family transcriptional regulator n=1 Tax=Novosphingobium sp. 9U TaxID=2653158 RepID=UPI0012F2DB14|nr:TetR/AcrR family transcriptional regulator [Novosphingobium sp. 9U]VWX50021.1 TetR family transcriptional regulator [Novosphingobium sp. 9U]